MDDQLAFLAIAVLLVGSVGARYLYARTAAAAESLAPHPPEPEEARAGPDGSELRDVDAHVAPVDRAHVELAAVFRLRARRYRRLAFALQLAGFASMLGLFLSKCQV
jgi:hypothetical protein